MRQCPKNLQKPYSGQIYATVFCKQLKSIQLQFSVWSRAQDEQTLRRTAKSTNKLYK